MMYSTSWNVLISNANSIILGFFDILSESLSAFLMFTTFYCCYSRKFYSYSESYYYYSIRLETKSCRILPLTYGTKYDMT